MTKENNKSKVICIGWHKTGTSTMGMALLKLGYTVVGARLDLAKPLLNGNRDAPIKVAEAFEALQDVPWAALYKELDEAYPHSKFILTVRDEQQWLNSASKHFKDKYVALHEWLYGEGVLKGNEGLYLNRYRQHYCEVKEYFKGRSDDLLVMDFAAGDGWEKLCSFLEKPVPKKPFPHSNKGKHNYNWKDKAFRFIRSLVPVRLRKWRVETLEKWGLHYGRNRFNNFEQNERELKSDREVSISKKD